MSGIESPPGESRHYQVSLANAAFWGARLSGAAVVQDQRGAAPDRSFRNLKNGDKSLPHRHFASVVEGCAPSGLFPALQGSGALLYAARREPLGFRLFLGSSAVEHSTVNRMVAGSNPARGAK